MALQKRHIEHIQILWDRGTSKTPVQIHHDFGNTLFGGGHLAVLGGQAELTANRGLKAIAIQVCTFNRRGL